MPIPDLSALSPRDQVTFWIGSVTRGCSAIEALMRRVLRDLAGGTWDEPVEDEPWGLERVRERLKGVVRATPQLADHVEDIVRLLGDVKVVNSVRVELVHSLWIEQTGENVFRRAGASMALVDDPRPLGEFRTLALRSEFVVAQMMWLSSLVSAQGKSPGVNPLAPFGWAVVRGEFTVRDDGGLEPNDPALSPDRLFDELTAET